MGYKMGDQLHQIDEEIGCRVSKSTLTWDVTKLGERKTTWAREDLSKLLQAHTCLQ
jgi:hypothetical protein